MNPFKRITILLLAVILAMTSLNSCAGKQKEVPWVLKEVVPEPLFNGENPSKDKEFNVLMIGNSYSYYWLDELWGLLNDAGYKNVTICDVYYSGCRFEQHWDWYVNGETNYRFQIFDENGRTTREKVGLEECLAYKNWDFIGFQQSGTYMYSGKTDKGPEDFADSVYNDLPKLYQMVYSNFPHAEYTWTQHWTHEVGTSNKKGLKSIEVQQVYHNGYRDLAHELCPLFGLTNVPLGDAWQSIRHDPLFYIAGDGDYPELTLHTRVLSGNFVSGEGLILNDLSHDGDIGGGQYLNACVFFEVLTHKSVVGNGFKPEYIHTITGESYKLTDEQISKLQNAAHEAVLGYHGEEYYK